MIRVDPTLPTGHQSAGWLNVLPIHEGLLVGSTQIS